MCSWPPAGDLLDAAEICDLLKGVVLIVCCVVMHYIDVSVMYHLIRGQTVIKLYIFFNMLDVRPPACPLSPPPSLCLPVTVVMYTPCIVNNTKLNCHSQTA